MCFRTEDFEKLATLICRLPVGQHFDVSANGIDMQASTQKDFALIRACFPGTVWKKEWVAACEWWKFKSSYDGVSLRVYACHEAPAHCQAITEVREVEKKVPVSFETQLVTETVIVGWDCAGNSEPLADRE